MKKLDDKAEKCVFFGVSDASKAYKLFNPLTKKVVTNRDVVFYEENTWDWKGQQPNQVLVDNDAEQEHVHAPIMHENSTKTTQTTTKTSQSVAEVNEKEAQSIGRVRSRPAWMEDYEVTGLSNPITHFGFFADCDPTTFESAVKEEIWRKAMDDEINSIEKNNTWEMCNLPKGHKTIGVKWVFKTKLNKIGEVDKYKACLVVKGYKKQDKVDYIEVFSPFARHDTIRLVALAAQNSWPIFQLHVKSSCLHGYLEELVFIEQPPGYIKVGNENKVYKLKKALY